MIKNRLKKSQISIKQKIVPNLEINNLINFKSVKT